MGAIEERKLWNSPFSPQGVGVGRKVAEEGLVEFAAGESGVENFRIDAGGDGAEMLVVEQAD